MKRVSHNVRSHRRSGVKQQAEGAFFSAAFEAEGAVDYDEYKKQKGGQGR